MARRTPPPVEDDFTERIVDIDVSSEMQTSFLEYAYSVIYSRALPDARDGLKPVQRRILYSMQEMGVRPDRGHVKCARVVGEVMGKYHPHGDGAIYDALVRTAQPWTMRLTLVDGHGNFGSPDAGPAAMRYTECRMAPAALAMTDGLDADTVDFKPNYDGKDTEPTVLPAAFPNLLVNGASGIAVGMATNCAPHNLIEVVQALRHLIKHPDADLDTLMRFIPGPDLPGGGKIIGLDGIRDAYATGKGSFRIRATARVEQVHPRRKGIVITELPYMIGPEKVIEQLKTLVTSRKLQGIADVKDLTDLANGTRLVIEVKNGFNPDALLEQLYKLTKLEDSFAINSVALVDGQPRTLSLPELLTVYLEHRYEVTRRRTEFERAKAADRLHLVEGLLIAILDIDDVIAIIRSSDDTAHARSRLIDAFDLTEIQANYILEMPLRRLTKYSTIELETERDALQATIAELTEILDNPEQLRTVVGNELAEIAKQHGTPRRTILLASSGVVTTATAAPLEITDDPCWVLLSSAGLLARTVGDDPLPTTGARANHDVIISAVPGTARGDLGVVTSTGRLIRINALDLPTVPTTANAPNLQGGTHISELITLEGDERVLCLTTTSETSLGLALGTARGVVKRVNPEVLGRDSWDVIRLEPGDAVVGAVELTTEACELTFITNDAQLLHFPATSVRPQGRSGGGMAGIKLGPGGRVVFFGAVPTGEAVVLTVSGSSKALPGTDPGSVKLTPYAEYPGKGRATGGVRCHRFLKGEDTLLTAWAGPAPA
ncbi:MAG TPA: DNA topoisomerase IV subunit A, partial [Microlunatus sp.]|nr:DNA topoisomerase IV subunit A [Microlunatus sp.]